MIDITDVKFEAYKTDYAEAAGYVVDPKSDEKEVFIPSPPTKMKTKINPRAGVILLAENPVTESYEKLDALKGYAKEEKLFIACVAENSTDAVEATYRYMISGSKRLNIKKDDICVKYIGDRADAAQTCVDYLIDELDADLEDAEELVI